eukprot:TRINITY_DN2340_c3_g1_i1.p1 TRINITY_DN2340_c3_g1~~TRINITY_DN2340_c3_g1_i1.p1  ORF type:complete len:696 (+),score=351.28 TRINITY_DN2340_c3_g1_i1:66-2153(+)
MSDQGEHQTPESVPVPDPGPANEISTIVALMNQYLGTHYSLVEFDSFSGLPLLQKLNDVFGELHSEQHVDIAQEQATTGGMGTTLQRMTTFLHSILNYKLPTSLKMDFEQNFVNGEKQVIYPIMHWVLSHMPQNRKRVYLSKYLIPVEVPEDLRASDDGVREVYNQYKQLVDDFIQTHRTVEKLRENVTNPQEVGRTINTLEKERDTLKQKITTTKEKLKGIPQWEGLLKAAQTLRQAQEDQVKNNEQLETQANALYTAEMKLAGSEQTLKELRRDLVNYSHDEMLKKMAEDVKMNTMLLHDKLPKDIEKKRVQLQAIHTAMHENIDLNSLQHEITGLEAEIAELKKKKQERLKDKEAQQLQMFRQQATLTAGRKAAFHEELQGIKGEIAKVKAEIQRKEDDLSRFSNEKIPKGEDFVKYVNSLRENYSNYKRMGAELGELRAEYGVLQRTEELLMAKVDKKEYQGLLNAQQRMGSLTEQMHELDNQKTMQLEKLSDVVKQFISDLQDRRLKLAPQILDLRNRKQKAQVVESAYLAAKETYETEKAKLESETGKLQEEVDQYQSECRLNESLYHRLNCQLSIAAIAWNRVKDEKDFAIGERKLDERYDTWGKMLEATTKQLEQKSQQLRIQKKDIEQNHDHNLQQMEWFKNLQRLLECKVNYYKRETTEKDKSPSDMLTEGLVLGGTGNATVMVL